MTFLETIIIFAVIIFIGYFIKSTTGFAGALFSVPLLALFFDIKLAVLVVSIMDLLIGLILFWSVRKHIDKKEVAYILAGAFFGTIIGVFLLKSFASTTLKIILGGLVIIFALKMLFEKHFVFKKLKSWLGTIFGALGGVMGGLFSTNGPPITLYLSHQLRNKQTLRGTLITIFLIDAGWRNILYWATGAFNTQILKIALFMMPVIIIATVLGSKVYLKLSQATYRILVGIILLISGMLLIIK